MTRAPTAALRWAAPILLSAAAAAPAAEPLLHKDDIFVAGTNGYTMYRIPGLIVTAKGTLLAWCEARRGNGNDWDPIDILVRRSTDSAKTWSDPFRVGDLPASQTAPNPVAVERKFKKPGEVTHNNAVMIADRSGAVHLLFCIEYGRCWYARSDDDGLTFGAPAEITDSFAKFRPEYDWKVLATGPAHGIQLKTGRLVVPVWLSKGTGGNAHRPSAVATIFSDDAGKTWKRGDIVAQDGAEIMNPNETCAVELADGRVMLNIRNESAAHRRAVAISPDGATGWSKPAFDDQLIETICMAAIARVSAAPPADRNRIVFSNPHWPETDAKKQRAGANWARKNLSVKLSYDEGKTWPVNRLLEEGFSGYSDLAAGPDGTLYCLYERGSTDGKSIFRTKSLCVARFNLEWLTDGKDAGK